MVMRAEVFHLLAEVFRPFFLLVHFIFPKSLLAVGHPEFLWQRFFTNTADFVFAAVNRRIAIWTTKFHF